MGNQNARKEELKDIEFEKSSGEAMREAIQR